MVSDSGDADGPRVPKVTGFDKLFFEQLVYNWITAHPATRPVVYANSWFFFFEITVRVCLSVMYSYLYRYVTDPRSRAWRSTSAEPTNWKTTDERDSRTNT